MHFCLEWQFSVSKKATHTSEGEYLNPILHRKRPDLGMYFSLRQSARGASRALNIRRKLRAVFTKLPLVSVVILNWNLPEDTVNCVRSVLRSDYPRYQITVIDNGSTDGSAEFIKEKLSDSIDLIINEKNLGFGKGNNQGIQESLACGADYTLILNNDTTVAPNMLSELMFAISNKPQIGIAGPVIHYGDKPDQIWFMGLRFIREFYVIQLKPQLRPPLDRVEEVDFVSGCGMLVSRDVWETIGLFDPEFFMYYEDLDLCIRARRAGFRLVTATRAKMWHYGSVSSGGRESPVKQYYLLKSGLIFYRKHTRGIWLLVNVFVRIGQTCWIMLKQLLIRKSKPEEVKWFFKNMIELFRS